MARPKKQIFDPLIQAMIDRLPKPGEEFRQTERTRWLALMKANMDLVYGSTGEEVQISGEDRVEQARRIVETAKAFADANCEESLEPLEFKKPTAKFKKPTYPDFYIGQDHVCYNRKGDPIMPEDVKGELVDLRGVDGDADIIIWADGSTGMQGDIVVSAG